MRRIGIDVGGTNTDAVLVDGTTVMASVKVATTTDIMTGISRALAGVIEGQEASGQVEAVMVGTTRFTNAIVEGRNLDCVACLRIGLPASRTLTPLVDWPSRLAKPVGGPVCCVEGGHEVDGRPLVALDEKAIAGFADRIAGSGCRNVAIASIFSPLNRSCEERARDIIRGRLHDCRITLSADIGRIGLLARENAAILNASIRPLAERFTRAMNDALGHAGLDARLYLTRNDGTVLLADEAERFPVFSLACGPTNSMRGAALLSGLDHGIVVDVGGTTSDVGMLEAGFPREANNVVTLSGIRTLFRMPDLISIGLGGGSLVDEKAGTIGPASTGHEIDPRARIFGGDDLTASDLGVAGNRLDLGDRRHLADLDPVTVDSLLGVASTMLADAIDRIKVRAGDVPVIAVGGGAFLVADDIRGASEVIRVEHGAVANAVGAAMAQVSGECDRVFTGVARDEALRRARSEAEERAIAGGANVRTLQTVDVEDLPLAYLPGNALRARVRVVGDIATQNQPSAVMPD